MAFTTFRRILDFLSLAFYDPLAEEPELSLFLLCFLSLSLAFYIENRERDSLVLFVVDCSVGDRSLWLIRSFSRKSRFQNGI